MAETQLSLLQQAVGQGLYKLDEVVADASADLANSLVRSAWNCEIFLNCGRQSGFNLRTEDNYSRQKTSKDRDKTHHSKREFARFLSFWYVGIQESL